MWVNSNDQRQPSVRSYIAVTLYTILLISCRHTESITVEPIDDTQIKDADIHSEVSDQGIASSSISDLGKDASNVHRTTRLPFSSTSSGQAGANHGRPNSSRCW